MSVEDKLGILKNLNGDTKVEVDGLELTVDELRELGNGYMRQSDYTKKTQAVAEKRKKLDNMMEDFPEEVADNGMPSSEELLRQYRSKQPEPNRDEGNSTSSFDKELEQLFGEGKETPKEPKEQPAVDPRLDQVNQEIVSIKAAQIRDRILREEGELRDKFEGNVGKEEFDDMRDEARAFMKKNKVASFNTAFKQVAFDHMSELGTGDKSEDESTDPAVPPLSTNGRGSLVPDSLDTRKMSESETDQAALEYAKKMAEAKSKG